MYTEDELAALADTTVEQVRRMTDLRIVTPGPEGFGRSDIQLVRIAEAMDAAGIGLDDIGTLIANGDYSMGWGELLYPEPVPTSSTRSGSAIDAWATRARATSMKRGAWTRS